MFLFPSMYPLIPATSCLTSGRQTGNKWKSSQWDRESNNNTTKRFKSPATEYVNKPQQQIDKTLYCSDCPEQWNSLYVLTYIVHLALYPLFFYYQDLWTFLLLTFPGPFSAVQAWISSLQSRSHCAFQVLIAAVLLCQALPAQNHPGMQFLYNHLLCKMFYPIQV